MYRQVLAHIHRVGFQAYRTSVEPDLLRLLPSGGRVVELGCGSGEFLHSLVDRGFTARGFDLSESMVESARGRGGEAAVGDWRNVEVPPCDAVVAISEVLNYADSVDDHRRGICTLFERCAQALPIGGLLLFDVAGPGQVDRRTWSEGPDWHCAVDIHEADGVLTRRIVAFARLDGVWLRDEETHTQILLTESEWTELVRAAGFSVSIGPSYGSVALPGRRFAVIARRA